MNIDTLKCEIYDLNFGVKHSCIELMQDSLTRIHTTLAILNELATPKIELKYKNVVISTPDDVFFDDNNVITGCATYWSLTLFPYIVDVSVERANSDTDFRIVLTFSGTRINNQDLSLVFDTQKHYRLS